MFERHDLLFSRNFKVSNVLEPFFSALSAGSSGEPFTASSDDARYGIANFNACSRNSFFTNSLTKTRSGPYGELPPNAKRAVTRCSAAVARSAVRSTIAMVLLWGETSCLYVGWWTCVSWSTCRHVASASCDGVEETTAKVSGSRTSSVLRRSGVRARRLFSSYHFVSV